MSYTSGVHPDDLDIIWSPVEKAFVLGFTCPRCGHKVTHNLSADDLLYGFEVECNHPTCRKPDERAGYTFYSYPCADGSMLGLSDRPLHEDGE